MCFHRGHSLVKRGSRKWEIKNKSAKKNLSDRMKISLTRLLVWTGWSTEAYVCLRCVQWWGHCSKGFRGPTFNKRNCKCKERDMGRTRVLERGRSKAMHGPSFIRISKYLNEVKKECRLFCQEKSNTSLGLS